MVKHNMASNKEASGSKVTSGNEFANPPLPNSSDGVVLPITGHKLNSQNYLQWS